MGRKLVKIPWKGRDVPHALIDIIRGCNIVCENCYNTSARQLKSVDDVKKELDLLQSLRKLESVSIIGGEPLLHPNLFEILAVIHERKISIEILTNGLLLNDDNLARFKELGVNVVLLHIEATQNRSDLASQTQEEVSKLRRKIAAQVGKFGIEVGLSVTTYREKKSDLILSLKDAMTFPEVNFVLVTLYRNMHTIEDLRGNIFDGFKGRTNNQKKEIEYSMSEFEAILKDELSITPFAFLPARHDPNFARWLSYFVSVYLDKDKRPQYHSLSPSFFEPIYLWLYRKIKGHYPFTQKSDPKKLKGHLFINGLFGGDFKGNMLFHKKFKNEGDSLKSLRILVQTGAELDESGNLIYCESCPDAVVKNGTLVPVCIADRVVSD